MPFAGDFVGAITHLQTYVRMQKCYDDKYIYDYMLFLTILEKVLKLAIGLARDLAGHFRLTVCKLRLKAFHNAAMHLTYPAFAQIKRGADLFHRHLFIVVQNHD